MAALPDPLAYDLEELHDGSVSASIDADTSVRGARVSPTQRQLRGHLIHHRG